MEKFSPERPQENRVPFERNGEYAESYFQRITKEQDIIDEANRILPELTAKFKASKSEQEKSQTWKEMKKWEKKRQDAQYEKEGIMGREGGKNLKSN